MKTIKLLLFLLCACLFSGGLLYAQNPVSIICEGTLTDGKGVFCANEEYMVRLSVTNSDQLLLFIKEIPVTTNEFGAFLFPAENLNQVALDEHTKELVNIEVKVRPARRSNVPDTKELSATYHLEQLGPDAYLMKRREGQELNFSTQKPIWQFSDISPVDNLSSRFMISFSKDITDSASIIERCKTMHGDNDVQKAEPSPSKRSIKGGFAVGGYKK